jgi:hypothetical protein
MSVGVICWSYHRESFIMPTVALHPSIEPLKDLVPIPDIDADVLTVLRESELTEPVELSD